MTIIEIRDLYVVPSERDQGLARSLMECTIQNHSDKEIILSADSWDNTSDMTDDDLVAWYGRLGFEMGCEFIEGHNFMTRHATVKPLAPEVTNGLG
ncbi:MAG: GNAT family N-acetyltransferase [Cyanobacteria bacterium P01_C01_bin.121]